MPLVIWDLLKLVTAAVLCGLAVSVAAACIALLLSGNAEAHGLPVAEPADMDAAPGVLIVGAGCDGVELPAVERDWYVRINGRVMDVRVMQTWVVPPGTEGAAVFQVQLPRGAELKTLGAQTPLRDRGGRRITADAYARLSSESYLSLTQNQMLVTYSPDGDVTTSPLVGLKAGDTLVVQYIYTITKASAQNGDWLSLMLERPDNLSQRRFAPADDDAIPTRANKSAVQGSVWVEWIGQKPAHILGIPRDASIERDTNLAGAIVGLSWSSNALKPGQRLYLAWLK